MKTVFYLTSTAALVLIGGCVQPNSSPQATIRSDDSSLKAAKDFDAYCSDLSEQMIKPFTSAISIENKLVELGSQVARGELTEAQLDLAAAQIEIKKAEHKYWGERWRDSGCVTRSPGAGTNLALSK